MECMSVSPAHVGDTPVYGLPGVVTARVPQSSEVWLCSGLGQASPDLAPTLISLVSSGEILDLLVTWPPCLPRPQSAVTGRRAHIQRGETESP